MNVEQIGDVGSEVALTVRSNRTETAQLVYALISDGHLTRVVRGSKSRNVTSLFDEWSAALQFPTYFGENWPAFEECISDMDWLHIDKSIVIVVTDADQILADSAIDRKRLLEVLESAGASYAEPITEGQWYDRDAVAFHVVFQFERNTTEWEHAGADFPELTGG